MRSFCSLREVKAEVVEVKPAGMEAPLWSLVKGRWNRSRTTPSTGKTAEVKNTFHCLIDDEECLTEPSTYWDALDPAHYWDNGKLMVENPKTAMPKSRPDEDPRQI